MARVLLKQVSKEFANKAAVHQVDLEVADRQFLVLVGPSGCGKTTVLRLIAGLEQPTNGEIYIGDRLVNEVAPKDRNIAMVFQNYALYPHMNVYKNLAIGLKLRKFAKNEIDRRVREAADILGLTDYLDRKPAALSGGERQRVAMGRAIVRKPDLFLFDEPLSNLDAKLRIKMRAEIKQLHARLETTVIYVTHDQVEAMTLADQIVVMNRGVIMQRGAPLEVYHHPKNLFVAGFIGAPSMNFFKVRPARIDGTIQLIAHGIKSVVPGEKATLLGAWMDRELILGVRPEHLTLTESGEKAGSIEGVVQVLEPLGAQTLVHVRSGDQDFVALCDPAEAPAVNQKACFAIAADKFHLFDSNSETALG
jgi:multiple sugar transport system ATP-binding protein